MLRHGRPLAWLRNPHPGIQSSAPMTATVTEAEVPMEPPTGASLKIDNSSASPFGTGTQSIPLDSMCGIPREITEGGG
jgi:hypothetical protein